MNLAILIGHFPPGPFGGAEVQAEAWAQRLADRHRVTVVTRRDPDSQPEHERRDGFEVVRLPIARIPLARTLLDLANVSRAVAALEPRPDALLCFQTFISGLAGVRIQRRLGIPALVWIRGEAEYRLSSSWRARTFSPGVWRSARTVLVQSEGMRAELLAELGRVDAPAAAQLSPRLAVVPNGIELPPTPGRRGGRVLAVGRLIPDKGMDLVVDAVAGMQGLLTVAGEGPEHARLEERARRHGLDARFEG
ncbi:MAG TPA: glycosyltransferase, partial [Candidatus Limnocylindria bacterium]|nr:glycosyltransferase [Candidatus Limnocylindria bacterium]